MMLLPNEPQLFNSESWTEDVSLLFKGLGKGMNRSICRLVWTEISFQENLLHSILAEGARPPPLNRNTSSGQLISTRFLIMDHIDQEIFFPTLTFKHLTTGEKIQRVTAFRESVDIPGNSFSLKKLMSILQFNLYCRTYCSPTGIKKNGSVTRCAFSFTRWLYF